MGITQDRFLFCEPDFALRGHTELISELVSVRAGNKLNIRGFTLWSQDPRVPSTNPHHCFTKNSRTQMPTGNLLETKVCLAQSFILIPKSPVSQNVTTWKDMQGKWGHLVGLNTTWLVSRDEEIWIHAQWLGRWFREKSRREYSNTAVMGKSKRGLRKQKTRQCLHLRLLPSRSGRKQI